MESAALGKGQEQASMCPPAVDAPTIGPEVALMLSALSTPVALFTRAGELIDANRAARTVLDATSRRDPWSLLAAERGPIAALEPFEEFAFRVAQPVDASTLRDAPQGAVRHLAVRVARTEVAYRDVYLVEFRDETERLASEERSQIAIHRLRKLLCDSVATVASALEVKDAYTAEHQKRVSNLARSIADEMRFGASHVEAVRIAGAMHDVGKIGIPGDVLNKPGRLSRAEFELIKSHARTGYRILNRIDFDAPIARIVLQHHERRDGSGYPLGLKGDAIMVESQILAVADVVEAIASDRPYRASLGVEAALDEIIRGRGLHYEPAVVDACMRVIRSGTVKLEARA